MASSSSSSATDNSPPHTAGGKKRKAGRKKFKETRHPIFKGVRQRNGRWICELRQPKNKKSRVWVGTFASPKMAAIAYDVAALALKGESTSLNFPELAHSFPRAPSSLLSSSSINDIRMMAVEAAEAFSLDEISSSPSLSSSLCSSSVSEEKVALAGSSKRLFIDEDELFNMPAIIAGMAEGLILTPPGMKRGFNWEEYENTMDLSLWSDE